MYHESCVIRRSLDNIHNSIYEFSNFSNNLSAPYYLMTKPFQVVDVYDVAAEIGKDFERIIDQFGTDAVAGLMPKVIGVLEELEDYAQKYEGESKDIVSLQSAVQRLESENMSRAQEKLRYEKELEQIEESWHYETKDLMSMIERLQEENKKLNDELKTMFENSEDQDSKVAQVTYEESSHRPTIANEDIQLMIRLKEVVDRQTQEMRELKKELAQKCLDLDAMQQQSERLAKLNAELRRKHCVNKKQSEQLLDEKSELQAKLCEKEQMIKKMRRYVVHSDSIDKNNEIDFGVEESIELGKSHIPKNQELAESMARLSEAQLIEQINAEGKMIAGSFKCTGDTRFSLHELKEVLMERNELKAKLIEVEEELAVYRDAGDEEPQVQGPVNKEPDEKMSPSEVKESGIQKFFSSLLERLNGP